MPNCRASAQPEPAGVWQMLTFGDIALSASAVASERDCGESRLMIGVTDPLELMGKTDAATCCPGGSVFGIASADI